MLDKIRLHATGDLPEEYVKNLGGGFDLRILNFLHVAYGDVVLETLTGRTDEEMLAWCFTRGRVPHEEEIEVWNGFMTKRGWRDEATEILNFRKKEAGFESRDDIQTMFEYIDADEA
jgi:gluconokinase